MGSRKHRWRGKWHGDGCDWWGLTPTDDPHWHVVCRDKDCFEEWIQPVLFDPSAYDLVP